jgi:hypothetical protein
MKGRTAWIGLFVACSIGVAAAAQPAAPPAGYEIDEQFTRKSPDGAITIPGFGSATPRGIAGKTPGEE